MNLLAFFAHPDDETMLAGGTLALLARQGAQVHYLCATRGEGGETGEPPVCTMDELGVYREQEMIAAVQALGGDSLNFMQYTDPRVGPDDQLYPFTDNQSLLEEELASWISRLSIDAVITHGSNGEYGHPAHIQCHQAAAGAVARIPRGTRPLLYTIAACYPDHPKPRLANKDDPAHLVIDVSPVLERKIQAALCHQSQRALFVRRTSRKLGRTVTVPEVILTAESLHRVFPPTNGRVHDPLASLLVQTGNATVTAEA